MIITDDKKQVVEGSDFHTIKSKVNSSKLAKLYGLLSNIYKNPIGSIVREYSSNAYDANKEAYVFGNNTYDEVKVKYPWIEDKDYGIDRNEFLQLKNNLLRVKENEPIIVGITEKLTRLQFYVKDFGIGLSPDRMNNIFFDYLSSTKEDTDDEIGGFGIGAKSALSIFKEFYIDTVYNGIQYQYMMGKDEKGIPEGTLLHQGEFNPNLENGTKISMYIESSQINNFAREMIIQLAYLNNVYYDFSDIDKKTVWYSLNYDTRKTLSNMNDFKIYDCGKWYMKSNPPLAQMHMSIGNICYTIDWNELQIDAIKEPFALKFEIGDLQPTPSRESIMYSDKAKALIKERIQELKDHYLEKIKEQNEDTDDFGVFIEKFNDKIDTYKEKEFTVNMCDLFGDDFDSITVNKVQYIPFRDANLKLSSNFRLAYVLDCDSQIYVNNARRKESTRYYRPSFDIEGHYFFEKGNKLVGTYFRKNAYILEEVKNSYSNVPIFTINKSGIENAVIRNALGVNLKVKEANIKLFTDALVEYVESNAIDYDAYEPTPTWHLKYDAGLSKYSPAKKKRATGNIPALSLSQRFSDWHRNTISLEKLSNYKGIILYGTSDEKSRLESANKILHKDERLSELCNNYVYNIYKHPIITLCVSKDNFKILKEMDNTNTIDEAILSVKTFRRILTARKISEEFEDLKFLNNITYMSTVLDSHYNKVKVFMSSVDCYPSNRVAEEFVKDAMIVAETHDLFVTDVMMSMEYLRQYATDIDLIRYLKFPVSDVVQKEVSKYLMDTKKKRIDVKFYISQL